MFKKNDTSNVENVTKHLQLCERKVFYPEDILEGVCCAIAMATYKPAALNVSQIKAYNVHNKETDAFLGCCYAIKIDGVFWGAFVGSDYIFSCPKKTFCFKETDVIRFPLKKDKEAEYTLSCYWDKKQNRIWARTIIKRLLADNTESCIFMYADGFSMYEAFRHCMMYGLLKD